MYGDVEFSPNINTVHKFQTTLQTKAVQHCAVTMKSSLEKINCDWFGVNLGWVASEAMREFLGENEHVNYVPASIVSSRKNFSVKESEFFFAEISARTDCFDFEKSKYTMKSKLVAACTDCV